MIRAFYGLTDNPFAMRDIELLPHQQEIHDTLKVQCPTWATANARENPTVGPERIELCSAP